MSSKLHICMRANIFWNWSMSALQHQTWKVDWLNSTPEYPMNVFFTGFVVHPSCLVNLPVEMLCFQYNFLYRVYSHFRSGFNLQCSSVQSCTVWSKSETWAELTADKYDSNNGRMIRLNWKKIGKWRKLCPIVPSGCFVCSWAAKITITPGRIFQYPDSR